MGIFAGIMNYLRRQRVKGRLGEIDDLIDEFADCPTDFEEFIAGIYREKGFDARATKRTGDGGIDIILDDGDYVYVAEVKLYAREHKVSREKIQKLHSAMIDYEADGAVFVTTSSFSAPAIEYAERHEIELIDGEALLDFIESDD